MRTINSVCACHVSIVCLELTLVVIKVWVTDGFQDLPESQFVEIDCSNVFPVIFKDAIVSDSFQVSHRFQTWESWKHLQHLQRNPTSHPCEYTSRMPTWFLHLSVTGSQAQIIPYRSVTIMLPNLMNRSDCESSQVSTKVSFLDNHFGSVLSCFAPLNTFLMISDGNFKHMENKANLSRAEILLQKVPTNSKFQVYVRFELHSGQIVHDIISLRTDKPLDDHYPEKVYLQSMSADERPSNPTWMDGDRDRKPIMYNGILLYEDVSEVLKELYEENRALHLHPQSSYSFKINYMGIKDTMGLEIREGHEVRGIGDISSGEYAGSLVDVSSQESILSSNNSWIVQGDKLSRTNREEKRPKYSKLSTDNYKAVSKRRKRDLPLNVEVTKSYLGRNRIRKEKHEERGKHQLQRNQLPPTIGQTKKPMDLIKIKLGHKKRTKKRFQELDRQNNDDPVKISTGVALLENVLKLKAGHKRLSKKKIEELHPHDPQFIPRIRPVERYFDRVKMKRGHKRLTEKKLNELQSHAIQTSLPIEQLQPHLDMIKIKSGHKKLTPTAEHGELEPHGPQRPPQMQPFESHLDMVKMKSGHKRLRKGKTEELERNKQLYKLPTRIGSVEPNVDMTKLKLGHKRLTKEKFKQLQPDDHQLPLTAGQMDPYSDLIKKKSGHRRLTTNKKLKRREPHDSQSPPEIGPVAYHLDMIKIKSGHKRLNKEKLEELERYNSMEHIKLPSRVGLRVVAKAAGSRYRVPNRNYPKTPSNSAHKDLDSEITHLAANDHRLVNRGKALKQQHDMPKWQAARYPPEMMLSKKGMYGSCESKYSCFHYPPGCRKDSNCLTAVVFVREGPWVELALMGNSRSYVAVGFSKDRNMGNEMVVLCKRGYGIDRVGIWKTYNVGNEAFGSRKNMLDHNQSEIIPRRAGYKKGLITCSFKLPLLFKSTDTSAVADFENEKYYLLLALGGDDNHDDPGLIHHHEFATASLQKVDLSLQKLDRSSRRVLQEVVSEGNEYIKAHEFLAVLTFVIFFPMGIFYSRYGQQAFPYKSVKHLPTWIIAHIICQTAGVVLTILTCVIMYAKRSGSIFSTVPGIVHFILSLLVLILSITQCGLGIWFHLMKLKGKNIPKILKWSHFIVGHVLFTIGCLILVRGPYLANSFVACSFSILVVYFIIIYALAHLLLMFNTDYLRRVQWNSFSAWRAFCGPTPTLLLTAPREQYDFRRAVIFFMWFTCSFLALFMIVIISISERSCNSYDRATIISRL